MTVSDLIKQLQGYPAHVEVSFARFGGVDEYGDPAAVFVSPVDKVRMKEVYFDEDLNEFLLAGDDAFDRDEEVEHRIILSYTE